MQKHIEQFFKFLQDKEGKPTPLILKISDPQTWGTPTKEDLIVKGSLDLRETNIKKLPQGLKVGEHLSLYRCTSLKELPKGLEVGGILDLQYCSSLKELPQDLKVDGILWLEGCTSLEKLSQGLKVDGGLFLQNTPIAKKYSEQEIRKMIEEGGGFVNGKIYI